MCRMVWFVGLGSFSAFSGGGLGACRRADIRRCLAREEPGLAGDSVESLPEVLISRASTGEAVSSREQHPPT